MVGVLVAFPLCKRQVIRRRHRSEVLYRGRRGGQSNAGERLERRDGDRTAEIRDLWSAEGKSVLSLLPVVPKAINASFDHRTCWKVEDAS
jgi:hypothetical protein